MNSIWTTETFILLIVAFFLGGIVKGVIGTGLPTIALALLTATIGIREGMAIILLPSILTNIQQGLLGGHLKSVLKRSWIFLFSTFVTIWIGAALLARIDISLLSGLLGVILLFYSAFGLRAQQLPQPGHSEKWLSPLVGAINGLLTGMTGSSVIPGVLYLQSLDLGRHRLVQTMGLLFLTSSTTLAFALQKNELLTPELLKLSALAFIPAYIGMFLGVRVRNRISDVLFRQLFFIFMFLLGLYIVIRAFL
ncbi:MAG: putative membrane protein YfcA [Desulforhopalus sp.]|jgi:uncharacterized membrane protein YfcA